VLDVRNATMIKKTGMPILPRKISKEWKKDFQKEISEGDNNRKSSTVEMHFM